MFKNIGAMEMSQLLLFSGSVVILVSWLGDYQS